jgi:molybdopterin-guanine dinucleotide biosynthesis protein A
VSAQHVLCGIFVGGKATRMHGQAKGLLPAPETGEPLVLRLARLARELDLIPVLVGESARYADALPDLQVIEDRPPGIGPMGGLLGLLSAAEAQGAHHVLALSCDLPWVSRVLLERLATHSSVAHVLAPRAASGQWEPLIARYDANALRAGVEQAIANGTRSFQRWFADLTVEELMLTEAERTQLVDWDTPEDVQNKP